MSYVNIYFLCMFLLVGREVVTKNIVGFPGSIWELCIKCDTLSEGGGVNGLDMRY